ncbi:hypothetical protein M0534_01460 [Methylonatrum kenyense]|uniref:hypothetical protein n=1 Tax=Methylonatrum kenyense TaxID=455253 RepID=UPI0020BED7A2|nr:hypothetical protein [Methylonatrum kenyense]MCK8514999.1 hypothetical protein [Methylonatrum kenyense]
MYSTILPDGRQAVWLPDDAVPLITVMRPGNGPPQPAHLHQTDMHCQLGLQWLRLEHLDDAGTVIRHTIPCPNPEIALNALLDFLDDGPVGVDFADLFCVSVAAASATQSHFFHLAGMNWSGTAQRTLARPDLKVVLCVLYVDLYAIPFVPILDGLYEAHASAPGDVGCLLVVGVPESRRAVPRGTDGCVIFAWS